MIVKSVLFLFYITIQFVKGDKDTLFLQKREPISADVYASDPELWRKQRDCLEFCGSHGFCEKGECQCEQPFCGEFCTRQCQHGGSCQSESNQCACGDNWIGEFCELPAPPLTTENDSQSASQPDKFLTARVIDLGTIPSVQEKSDVCNSQLGSLDIPFPSDIDLANIVSIQVMCIDNMRRKMYFGVHDTGSIPVEYGSADGCKGGSTNLASETMLIPRSASKDFRYFMSDQKIVVQKFGLAPELESCNIRATVTYFA
eukprot:c22091_g1_i1.p1 GENE.c22091_g1_i1~~c22091_g1_i1.p1  ORF type:complete len:267 (-),score=104.29 c22091_g1_i1:97-870(-)